MNYTVGDRVVYPMHGAGVISSIEKKEVMGDIKEYYFLDLPYGNTFLMIPVDNADSVGVRTIIDKEEVSKVLDHIKNTTIECNQNWNKRHRENLERLRTGNIYDVADVYKALLCREKDRALSTGEKKMLSNTRNILYSELSLSSGKDEEEINDLINNILEFDEWGNIIPMNILE